MLHMISSQFRISSRATRTFNTKLIEKIATALMLKPNSLNTSANMKSKRFILSRTRATPQLEYSSKAENVR